VSARAAPTATVKLRSAAVRIARTFVIMIPPVRITVSGGFVSTNPE
jgi:hypothetical protein